MNLNDNQWNCLILWRSEPKELECGDRKAGSSLIGRSVSLLRISIRCPLHFSVIKHRSAHMTIHCDVWRGLEKRTMFTIFIARLMSIAQLSEVRFDTDFLINTAVLCFASFLTDLIGSLSGIRDLSYNYIS